METNGEVNSRFYKKPIYAFFFFFPKLKSNHVTSWFKNLLRVPTGVMVKFKLPPMSPPRRLAVFYPSRRPVPLPVPSPCPVLHMSSFQMHRTTAPAVSSQSTYIVPSARKAWLLWLTPLPSQAHSNITSRKPPLTRQPTSVPASGSPDSTNRLPPRHPLSTLTVLPSQNHRSACVSPTF